MYIPTSVQSPQSRTRALEPVDARSERLAVPPPTAFAFGEGGHVPYSLQSMLWDPHHGARELNNAVPPNAYSQKQPEAKMTHPAFERVTPVCLTTVCTSKSGPYLMRSAGQAKHWTVLSVPACQPAAVNSPQTVLLVEEQRARQTHSRACLALHLQVQAQSFSSLPLFLERRPTKLYARRQTIQDTFELPLISSTAFGTATCSSPARPPSQACRLSCSPCRNPGAAVSYRGAVEYLCRS